MKAGFNRVDITPDIKDRNVELSGYGYFLKRFAKGVHSRLFADAIVLEGNNKEPLVMASFDLIGLDDSIVSQIKEGVKKTTGIPPNNIILTATHTHSGPATLDIFGCGGFDKEYSDIVIERGMATIVAAFNNMSDSSIGFAQRPVTGMSYNRAGGNFVDETATLMKIEGRTPIVAVHFSCHPVVFYRNSSLVSSDYVGAVREYLEKAKLVNGLKAAFFNGCCGDIDPMVMKERKGKTTPKDITDIGEALGKTVAGLYKFTKTSSEDISVVESSIEIPFNHDFSITDKIVAGNELDNFPGTREFIEGAKKRVVDEKRKSRKASIAGIKIGKWKILAVPVEIYASTGLQITRDHPYTFVITHANGNIGYLPPPEEFDKGSYAAGLGQLGESKRPYKRTCETVLLEGMRHVLKELEN